MSKLEGLILRHYRDVDDAATVSATDGSLQVKRDNRNLFAANVVYERDGWEPFVGSAEINHFYHDVRNLCGQHRIRNIDSSPGIHLHIMEKFNEHFPFGDRDKCVTVVANGVFSGAQCHDEKRGMTRFVRGASGVEIPFQDYWVFSQDKVIYRYSQMQNLQHAVHDARNSSWERM